jgi:hypothetical protein
MKVETEIKAGQNLNFGVQVGVGQVGGAAFNFTATSRSSVTVAGNLANNNTNTNNGTINFA